MAEGSGSYSSRRNSNLISLPPVSTDLGRRESSFGLGLFTAVTPPLSPAPSMIVLARPPTYGGGPLSSHPTSPIDIPGAWTSTTDLSMMQDEKSSTTQLDTPPSSAAPSIGAEPKRHDSFQVPSIPASAKNNNTHRNSSSMRKLFSFSSLRTDSSTSTSRTSRIISSPIPIDSFLDERASRPTSQESSHSQFQGIKRVASSSPSTIFLPSQGKKTEPRHPLRKRKSLGWFRRQSGMFLFGQNDALAADSANGGDDLDDVKNDESQLQESRPAGRDSGEVHGVSTRPPSRSLSPLPLLPDLDSLGMGSLDAESIFSHIGQ